MSLRFYHRAELGQLGGNSPGADTNLPEDPDFVRRIWTFFRSLFQMLARNDVHPLIVLPNM